MPGRWDSRQPGFDGGRHRAHVPLPGEQLPERIADMDDADVLGVDAGGRKGARHHLGGHGCHVRTLFGPVACVVRLVAAENPDHAFRVGAGTYRTGWPDHP